MKDQLVLCWFSNSLTLKKFAGSDLKVCITNKKTFRVGARVECVTI
jgi:hypothetical protein